MSAPDVLPARARPGLLPRGVLGEVLAAAVALVGSVLLAAPVGLVWAAVAPRAEVVAGASGASVADPTGRAFVTGDVAYLATTVVAGLLVGLVAVTVGRRYGPGCVVGVALGGLLAAEVARRTGMLVGRDEAQAFLDSGAQGVLDVPLRLRALSARVGWPLAALVVVMLAAAWRVPVRED